MGAVDVSFVDVSFVDVTVAPDTAGGAACPDFQERCIYLFGLELPLNVEHTLRIGLPTASDGDQWYILVTGARTPSELIDSFAIYDT